MEHECTDFGELSRIRKRREQLEAELAKYDERVFDLESVYLKHCLALGGNLFDGFGTELSLFTSNALATVNNLQTDNEEDNKQHLLEMLQTERKSINKVKVEESNVDNADDMDKTKNASADETKVLNTSALPLISVNDGYTRNSVKSTLSMFTNTINPLTVYEKNKCHSFSARIHNFSPTERIFSTSSTGAIGRVERIKALRKLNHKGHVYKTKKSMKNVRAAENKFNNFKAESEYSREFNFRTIADANQNTKNSSNIKNEDLIVNVKRERSEDGEDENVSDDNIESKTSSRRKTRRREN